MGNNIERSVVLTATCVRALRTIQLSQRETLTLWHLVAIMPPAGNVISNAELGRELEIDRAHITRAMQRLRELGFLMRGAKVGISYHYKLNPAFFRIIS